MRSRCTTHVWVIEGRTVHPILGGWESYLEWRDGRPAPAGAGKAADAPSKQERRAEYERARRQANEQRRLQKQLSELEARIEMAEQALTRINEAISSAADNNQVETVRELSKEHGQKSARLKELWDEWEQLGEKLSG